MDDSAEIRHLLMRLDHGTPDEKLAARTQLWRDFLARGQGDQTAERTERTVCEGAPSAALRPPDEWIRLGLGVAEHGRARFEEVQRTAVADAEVAALLRRTDLAACPTCGGWNGRARPSCLYCHHPSAPMRGSLILGGALLVLLLMVAWPYLG